MLLRPAITTLLPFRFRPVLGPKTRAFSEPGVLFSAVVLPSCRVPALR